MTNSVIRKRHNYLIVDKKDKDRTPWSKSCQRVCVVRAFKWKSKYNKMHETPSPDIIAISSSLYSPAIEIKLFARSCHDVV